MFNIRRIGISLAARITLVSVFVLLLGIWSLTLYARQLLHADVQRQMGEQQFALVKMVAAQINNELNERKVGLENTASRISEKALRNSVQLQSLLSSDRWMQAMFNAGFYVTDSHAVAIASVPVSAGRAGKNFADRDAVADVLKNGNTSISKPTEAEHSRLLVVSMTTPIRDDRGQVIGALVGILNLSEFNLLDEILSTGAGNSGRYFVIDSNIEKVISSSERQGALKDVAPAHFHSLSDKYLHGLEGWGLATDSAGNPLMTSSSQVSAAAWHVEGQLPMTEGLAKIRAVEQSVIVAALFLTLVMSAILWWLLKRNLQPLVSTASALKSLSESSQFPSNLAVTHDDEIGEVIHGFNHLLRILRKREVALRSSERLLLDSQKIAGLGNYLLRADGTWSSSEVLNCLFGIDGESTRNLQTWLDLVHPDDRAMMRDYFAQLVASKMAHFDRIYRIVRRSDETARWVHGLGLLEFNYQGEFVQMQGTVQDITEGKEAELRLSKLSRITEQAPLSIVITDLTGAIEYTNPYFSQVTGYSAEEVVGLNPRKLQSGLTPSSQYTEMWQCLVDGKIWRGEFHNKKKNGDVYIESATIAPVLNNSGETTHYVALKEDITQRKHMDTALQKSLHEKVALLNEVHHRVKNNLQIISSMLRLEAGRSEYPVTRAVLADMQSRIRSMAILHETLYRSGTFASINLGAYLKQLTSQTFRAQSLGNSAVRLELELAPLSVDLDTATPCGLLVNELLTNSLKHAFPEGKSGTILVQLELESQPQSQAQSDAGRAAGEWLVLRVSDDGVGLPEDFAVRSKNSLGMQLVSDLVRQLHGTLAVESVSGASFVTRFQPKPLSTN